MKYKITVEQLLGDESVGSKLYEQTVRDVNLWELIKLVNQEEPDAPLLEPGGVGDAPGSRL